MSSCNIPAPNIHTLSGYKRLLSGWCVHATHGHPASHGPIRTHGPIGTHHGADGGSRGYGEIGVAAWRLATGDLYSTTSHTDGTTRGDAGGTTRGDTGSTTGGDTGDTGSTQTDVRACHLVEVLPHHVLSIFVCASLSWLNVESQYSKMAKDDVNISGHKGGHSTTCDESAIHGITQEEVGVSHHPS